MYAFMAVLMCAVAVSHHSRGRDDGRAAPGTKAAHHDRQSQTAQERLKTEGVYAGPVDGEMTAQTEAALRAYQEKQGSPGPGRSG